MFLRVLFFALMALGLTGFGTVAWLVSRPPPTAIAAQPAPQKKFTLVAARPIHAGTLLKPEDLATKEVTDALGSGEIALESADAYRAMIGALVRRGLKSGEMMRADDIMKPGDHGFLAAVLDPGQRGITIGVDAASGSAGLIWPGDRVDVILTQSIPDPSIPPGRRVAAETVLRNARVIAIDQQLVQGAAPVSGDPASRTVTLEVSPNEAERVSVAMRLGRLSLSLRAAATGPQLADIRDRTTWAMDVSSALGVEATPASEYTVRIFRGAADPKEFKF
ncbi:MAG: Flp pilus assembly protein CpaB [Acetobacteraceae bacterium]